MEVPVWFLVLLLVIIAVFVLLLWSARAQRKGRVEVHNLASVREMMPSITGLTGSWLVEGNAVELLYNGDGFFPVFLQSIRDARESIHVEAFAWWKGDICEELSRAFAAKAREGVEVRLLIDYVGSMQARDEDFDRMRDAGVHLVRFRPPELRALGRMNQRTHRKLGVFDGRVGFIMGHGFAEEWTGDGRGEKSWGDRGARVVGPVVLQIQAAFARNWVEETGEVIAGEQFFPPIEAAGDVPCQVIPSLPCGGVSPATLLHKLLIASSNEEVLIQNPYFCPDDETTDLLVEMVERGVSIRIMVPGPVTDSPAVLHAGHTRFPRLLRAGVEIWEYQPSLPHQKVVVVDRCWCCVGSMNFDERSFDINAEIALGMFHDGLAGELRDAFEEDLKHSKRLDPDEWDRRGLWHRALDHVAYVIRGQL